MKLSYLFRTREIPNDWLNSMDREPPYTINSLLVIETTAIPGLFFLLLRSSTLVWPLM